MNSKFLVPLVIVVAGLVIAGAIVYTKDSKETTIDKEILKEEQIAKEDISIEFDEWPTLGDPNAPVVLVEYSDFACSFCARFAGETLPLIKQNYIETEKVYLVYKDFIIVGGDRAAEAAHCAAEQDKYWEYHDLLFEKQTQDRGQWSNSQVHRGYAQELGLDEEALITCFEERRYQQKVSQSTQEAVANGGTGTPFFLINGQPVSGAQPYSSFQTIIDGLLQEK